MNRIAWPAQVERTSRGEQLMGRLGKLWATVSPSEAAEGHAAIEAAMASSAAVHCTTLARVGAVCPPHWRTTHDAGTCAQHSPHLLTGLQSVSSSALFGGTHSNDQDGTRLF